ncbi:MULTISPECIES: hypothetical protein [unclassified Microcoleus]|uniref:hypothetical protein n=1 Tax=unclassified Microcoleus TaxID=2642155 RepID=UPI0025F92E85|nr:MULTISPECIES: hypothetical protein [unclassified Microcoleus]
MMPLKELVQHNAVKNPDRPIPRRIPAIIKGRRLLIWVAGEFVRSFKGKPQML